MSFYESIIKTALLGTERQQIDWAAMPEAIQHRQASIEKMPHGEDQFLALVALAQNYKNAGSLPQKDAFATIGTAEMEQKPYCSRKAESALNRMIIDENHPLLGLWLAQCAQYQYIVQPIFLPRLFDIARNSLEYRSYIVKIMGNRGAWLLGVHPFFKQEEKQDVVIENQDEILEHGTLDQRILVLKDRCAFEPEQVRNYIHDNWKKAPAKEKTALLDVLQLIVSAEDEAFLETQLESKAQTVRDAALQTLKCLPDSTISTHYKTVLFAAFAKKVDAKMLVQKSTKLVVNAPESIPDYLFKHGIEKESTDKKYTNPEFWVNQVLTQVNPSLLETHLGMTANEIVEQCVSQKTLKKYITALESATIKFGNNTWASALIPHIENFNVGLVEILPIEHQLGICENYASRFPYDTMNILKKSKIKDWSLEYSKQLMTHAAQSYYFMNKGTYKDVVPFIHKDIVPFMANLLTEESNYYAHWQTVIKDVEDLLTQREALNHIWS
jgi:hypothetical protein